MESPCRFTKVLQVIPSGHVLARPTSAMLLPGALGGKVLSFVMFCNVSVPSPTLHGKLHIPQKRKRKPLAFQVGGTEDWILSLVLWLGGCRQVEQSLGPASYLTFIPVLGK